MWIAQVAGGEVVKLLDHTRQFSFAPTDEQIKEQGFFPVSLSRPYDPATQKLVKVDPYVHVDRVYTVEVVDMTAEEIADKQARETAQKEASIRKRRNQLLADSDWVVIKALESGETVPADWQAYRTALRDLTSHANFPDLNSGDMEGNGSDWPTAPSA